MGNANLTFDDYLGLNACLLEWVESYDRKDWVRLRNCLAPELQIDYSAFLNKRWNDMPADEFVAMISSPQVLGNALLKTQHLVGASKWEAVGPDEVVGVHQTRSAHQRYTDPTIAEVAVKGHAHSTCTLRYKKLGGEWKFAGLRPDFRWAEGDFDQVFANSPPTGKKTIVVVGATGKQGGSVLPGWHVRALTRRPASDEARRLSNAGAEVVQGNLEDTASLIEAFEGAHAIFLNTDFWETYVPRKEARLAAGESPEPASDEAFRRETTNGRNAIVAAAAVPTLERLVYSALNLDPADPACRTTRSKHSLAKARIVEYIETKQPGLGRKTSFVIPGAYMTNAIISPRFEPGRGQYVLTSPVRDDFPMPVLDPHASMGPFVRALVEDEDAGVKLLAYDDILTSRQVAEKWGRASLRDVVLNVRTSREFHDEMGVPWELLDAMDHCNALGKYAAYADLMEPHQLRNPVAKRPFEVWLEGRDWQEQGKELGQA
ncbi:NAD(P)-binding protein [Apiospora saccharicola]